ncbi:SRPBCC family protein [Thiocapsa bogorovii]|uniref:SRPBCC family protein n=1 Tax=Thiocapsa bogorovii TaxID=521689 RepID=UPI001E6115BF|nr:SRPBCC family protein [Thiocapsa bogorovii]UHD17889.1 SRPBCC family protein [Thiocapsa bogorovii]
MNQVSRIIEAPAGVAWRILTDTREWPIWGPSVRAVDVPADLIGPGMRGRIQTPVGLWLPFEIIRWEPEHAWAWRVAGVEATGHRVDPLGPGRCRVTFEIPRWAPLYRLVCDAALRRIEERARTSA